jgi:hypothetical protein
MNKVRPTQKRKRSPSNGNTESTKWEINQSLTAVIPIFGKTGNEPEVVLKIEYRPRGSKGRYHAFSVSGKIPRGLTIDEIVGAYNARSGPEAWKGL